MPVTIDFSASLDWFGDGSVVFVPLSGHTPGSLGTFINRTPGERLFHVGDAVNTTEAIDKRRGKSIVLEPTDVDSARAEAGRGDVWLDGEVELGGRPLAAHLEDVDGRGASL